MVNEKVLADLVEIANRVSSQIKETKFKSSSSYADYQKYVSRACIKNGVNLIRKGLYLSDAENYVVEVNDTNEYPWRLLKFSAKEDFFVVRVLFYKKVIEVTVVHREYKPQDKNHSAKVIHVNRINVTIK